MVLEVGIDPVLEVGIDTVLEVGVDIVLEVARKLLLVPGGTGLDGMLAEPLLGPEEVGPASDELDPAPTILLLGLVVIVVDTAIGELLLTTEARPELAPP